MSDLSKTMPNKDAKDRRQVYRTVSESIGSAVTLLSFSRRASVGFS